jgi:Ran GTPase-activating protein (RanGAP) involved in mRNA processing and transport
LNFKIASALKVKHLDMSNNPMGDKAAKEFSTYFSKNQILESLTLANIGITREGIRRLRELIRYNPQLKTLVLKENPGIIGNVEMCERRCRFDEYD